MNSENKADLEKFQADIARSEQAAKAKREVDEMAQALREHKVSYDYSLLEQTKREMEDAKKIDYGTLSNLAIERMIRDNEDYMEAAKQAMTFITKSFKGVVPYFRKNLILVGGDTGDGKSTTVANIITTTITQENPATGKMGRCLVLTNEEAPEDFYNRITCHINNWQYINHDQFTDIQRATFKEWIPKLAKGGRLTVIGDTYEGVSGNTTTVEGIEQIFTNLIARGEIYDAVLIDYYQNVQFSKNNPRLNQFECQAKFAAILDKIKITYPGAIILMAQMKRLTDEEDTTPFNVRLKGSKVICDKATFIVELIPERKLLRSKWKVWKSRFTDSVGNSVHTGFDKGRFVEYDKGFQAKVALLIAAQIEKEQMESLEGVIK